MRLRTGSRRSSCLRYLPRGGSTNPSDNVAVRQADKNQDCKDHCGDAERGLLAVPFLRLPHCEVFASDDHEAKKPEGKADSQSGYGPDFGAVEDLGSALSRPSNIAAPSASRRAVNPSMAMINA